MRLLSLPAFRDNYLWVLVDDAAKAAVAVDPGDSRVVAAALDAEGCSLAAIWATHHHADHIGGNAELLARWPGIPVLGSAYDADHGRIPGLTRAVREGDTLELAGLRVRVLELPGHTLGHCAYFIEDAPSGPLLFSGDVLFGGGCGRLFEGSPAVMQASLAKVRALPDATRVCCAHEYTLANLHWAVTLEPDNTRLVARHAELAAAPPGARTVPLGLALERDTNPMLRWDEPVLRARFLTSTDVDTFAAVRAHRNDWRPPT